MPKCKKCNANIIFQLTPNGKWFPLDEGLVEYRKAEDGEDWVVDDKGNMIKCTFEFQGRPDGLARIPHWATCPYANDFRKR